MKLKSDGTLDRYKACLVAPRNRQQYGTDYDETFASVKKMTTIRTILVVATSQSLPLYQMDVKNAFPHGDLKEDVICAFRKVSSLWKRVLLPNYAALFIVSNRLLGRGLKNFKMLQCT